MENEELYEMELHEEKQVTLGLYVIRVPGGWIYRSEASNNDNWTISTTFIPFNNEFQ